MQIDELLEEIRTRLREAQENTVSDPWVYSEDDLIPAIRSAIRNLRTVGVTLGFDLSLDGVFDTDPTESQGVLIALKVSLDLLRGDLMQKFNNGELGISYRSVMDSYDSKTAATGLKDTLTSLVEEYRMVLTKALTGEVDDAVGVFGIDELAYTEA